MKHLIWSSTEWENKKREYLKRTFDKCGDCKRKDKCMAEFEGEVKV